MSARPLDPVPADVPPASSTGFWQGADLVGAYDTAVLRPVEAAIFKRYGERLSGRVLELGVGAGRLTRHLVRLANELHGIDVSPVMVRRTRLVVPTADISVGDLRDLDPYPTGSFDAVVAGFNVIDVLDHDDRLHMLDALGRIVVDDGTLVFSSHNQAARRTVHGPGRQLLIDLRHGRIRRVGRGVLRLGRRLENHRRLRRFERDEAAYAIVNDSAHDYSVLHYYITRDAQDGQLADHGFELIDCLDLEARPVPAGASAPTSTELHYVARRTPAARTDASSR